MIRATISVTLVAIGCALHMLFTVACQPPASRPEQPAVTEPERTLLTSTALYIHDRETQLCYLRYEARYHAGSLDMAKHYTQIPCTDEVLAKADPEFFREKNKPVSLPPHYGPNGEHCCGADRSGCP